MEVVVILKENANLQIGQRSQLSKGGNDEKDNTNSTIDYPASRSCRISGSLRRTVRRGVPPIPPPWTRRPLVQIAVVLDAGRGMSGLIHQAVTTEKELVQLQEKARARRQIEEQILQLAAQRRVYLLAHQPQSESARPTLGQAVVQVLREQATTTP